MKSNLLVGLWSDDPAWHGLPMTKNQQEKYHESFCTIKVSLFKQQCRKQGYSSWRHGRVGSCILSRDCKYRRVQRVWKSNTMVHTSYLPQVQVSAYMYLVAKHAVLWRFPVIPSTDVAAGFCSCAVQGNDKMITADNDKPPNSGNGIDNGNALKWDESYVASCSLKVKRSAA